MQNNKRLMPYLIRIGIIIFWIFILGFFLYFSHFLHFFMPKKSINVLVWGQVLDAEFIADFEKETGIHVNMSYFENNEEVFVKLRATQYHDYDLIMPSDWAAELLLKEGHIKKLDRSKITVWPHLYPALCGHYFDPHNIYTIPYYWSLFGLAVDKTYFKGKIPPATWRLIFDEKIMPKRIAMVEDARLLVLITALYLFGHREQLTEKNIDAIKKVLLRQKSRVEIYTDTRPEYVLVSQVVPVAVGLLGDFLKVMRHYKNIEFLMPREGCVVELVSFALTSTTKKDDLIYPFLNYIFRRDIVQKYVDKFDFFPAIEVDVEYDERLMPYVHPTAQLFKKVNFLKNIVPINALNDILIALKS